MMQAGAGSVTLTDAPAVLPALRRNAALNFGAAHPNVPLPAHQRAWPWQVHVAPLDWTEAAHVAALAPPYDVILAADVVRARWRARMMRAGVGARAHHTARPHHGGSVP